MILLLPSRDQLVTTAAAASATVTTTTTTKPITVKIEKPWNPNMSMTTTTTKMTTNHHFNHHPLTTRVIIDDNTTTDVHIRCRRRYHHHHHRYHVPYIVTLLLICVTLQLPPTSSCTRSRRRLSSSSSSLSSSPPLLSFIPPSSSSRSTITKSATNRNLIATTTKRRRQPKRLTTTTTTPSSSSSRRLWALSPQQLGQFEPLLSSPKKKRRRVACYDLSLAGPQPFSKIWDFQKTLLESQLHRLSSEEERDQWIPSSCHDDDDDDVLEGRDAIILLQHEPVYTLGTGSDPSNVLRNNNDINVVRIERGGEVTYHGPGQLVIYPVIDLRGYKRDIHWYVRALEEVIVRALDKAGVEGATREDNLTGVWIQNRKVAAVGVKVRRWVTMHGGAVNVLDESLKSNFEGIVPCGLVGREVCCVADFLGDRKGEELMMSFGGFLKEAWEEVFEVELVDVEMDDGGVVH